MATHSYIFQEEAKIKQATEACNNLLQAFYAEAKVMGDGAPYDENAHVYAALMPHLQALHQSVCDLIATIHCRSHRNGVK